MSVEKFKRHAEILSRKAGIPLNSRQIAELIWKEVEAVYTSAHEADYRPEPEDKEAGLQSIEGILEREAFVRPDPELAEAREKNGEA